jgi:hypothetical protein
MAYQYYYCPFRKPDETTLETKKKYTAKGAENCVICEPTVFWEKGSFSYTGINGAQGALKDVPIDAVLLIDGHGSDAGSGGLSNTGDVDLPKGSGTPVIGPSLQWGLMKLCALTPSRLMELLKMEGLKEKHIAIRMLTCYGAGPAASAGGLNPVDWYKSSEAQKTYQANGFFAKVLAQTMGKDKYKAIHVGGYRGRTWNEGTERTVVKESILSEKLVFAYGDKARYMVWYNGEGKEVPKPPVLRKSDQDG